MGLCERCKKAQATFHLTDIDREGRKIQRHLCDRCAAEDGLLPVAKSSVDINDILQSFVQGAKGGGAAAVSQLVCEHCGISYVEFRNQGLLGCAHDYDTFKEPLAKLIERAHAGATHHTGKSPKAAGGSARRSTQQDLRRLRRQLDEAVAAEDYERAAELRDRIRGQEGA